MEQFYHGIRQMKHEMKNHMTNIKGLVRNGSYGDIEQYIDHMDESMNVFEITIKTGNTVTDVIVNDKQKAAEKQGIQFQSEFSYPKSDGYNAYDIGVIMNNFMLHLAYAMIKLFHFLHSFLYCVNLLLFHEIWNYVFVAVLQLILFSVMLYAVIRLLKKKTMKLHIKELCYLLLIPITGILFVNIIFNILLIVNENTIIQLYEQFPVFLGVVPVVAALFYAGILITIVSYQKMIGLQEEKEKYFVEQLYAASLSFSLTDVQRHTA